MSVSVIGTGITPFRVSVDTRLREVASNAAASPGVHTIRLMTNNPAKYQGLVGHGIHIAAREPLIVIPNADNVAYLHAKRTRLNHAIGE